MSTEVSRRTVASNLAWSVPVITVAGAAPALAGSEQQQFCFPLEEPISRKLAYYPQRSSAADHTVTIQSDILQWSHDVRDGLGDVNQTPSSYVIRITNVQTGETIHVSQATATWTVDSGTVPNEPPVGGNGGDWQEFDAYPLYYAGSSPITYMGMSLTMVVDPAYFSETDQWSIQMDWVIQTDCGDSRLFSTTQTVTATSAGATPLGAVGVD